MTQPPFPGAVIFDMDGLIFDTEPVYKMAMQRTCAELGFTLDDQLYNSMIGWANDPAERELARVFGPGFSIPAFRKGWEGHWHAHVEQHGLPTKPGLHQLLDYLEQRGISRAVATSADLQEATISLRGYAQRFGAVITASQVRHGKPEPDLFLAAAEALGVAPERCLVLEDSGAGVRAARAAQMRVIQVPDLQQPSEETIALAYRVMGSLHEVLALLRAWERGD